MSAQSPADLTLRARRIKPGFRLFTSNRMERLAAGLCDVLSDPLDDPLTPETIVVQSRGMERWVSLEIASRLSVCANVRFPFPNAILAQFFSAVLRNPTDLTPFDPDILTWRVLKHILKCLEQPGFDSLRRYLGDGDHPAKPLQLAHRLAALFDQYLVFRPEMVLAWEEGNDEQWQAQLWRSLIDQGPSRHQASLRKDLLERLRQASGFTDGLPQRISIFGISALPPFHMEVFKAVSRSIQVNLFFLNPSSEYWADIQSGRQISRTLRRPQHSGSDAARLHLDTGNSLLASLGKLGKDFFQLIQALEPQEHDDFEDPGEATLLTTIQADILFLNERAPENRRTLSPSDRSIEIHSCHGPMREVEVLHDHLLALFEEHPNLGPKDVLVMTPDIHLYAPYISAVFDAQENPYLRIPFTVTDRSMRRENRIAEVFLSILELPTTRFTASQVLSLLEVEAVRTRFGISESDLGPIRQWIRDTGIRWGIDDRDRVRMGFNRSLANTWREGLDRLLLGYAMRGRDAMLFSGVLPYDGIEGGETAILDRFLRFIQTLVSASRELAQPRSLEQWRDTLLEILETLFQPARPSENDLLTLRRMVQELAETHRIASFDLPVDLEAVRYWLGQKLDQASRGLGFITGGVTFCAMLPMRAIPFPVICLIGMDDGAFPRTNRKLAFDLMAQNPLPGDRSQRNDDRYLFLEAILSARHQLYISHVGQSQDDNSSIPPSVLVCELIDAIEKTVRLLDGADPVVNRIQTLHHLQPFSPAYFDTSGGMRLFSYSEENCAAAISLRESQTAPPPFLSTPLPDPEDSWRQVELFELEAFLANPCKYLLTKRLQIQLDSGSLALEDRELFVLGGLETYSLQGQLMGKRLEGLELGPHLPIVQAAGMLPHGSVGKSSYSSLSRASEAFFSRLEPFIQGRRPDPVALNVSLGSYLLSGLAGPLSARGLVHYRPAVIKSKDRLRLWAQHLALLCVPEFDWTRTSLFIGKGSILEYGPVENAASHLQTLLDLYWTGLSVPFPSFPRLPWPTPRPS